MHVSSWACCRRVDSRPDESDQPIFADIFFYGSLLAMAVRIGSSRRGVSISSLFVMHAVQIRMRSRQGSSNPLTLLNALSCPLCVLS